MYAATRQVRPSALLVALVALALTLTACTFEVQPVEEHSTADGYLTFSFPAAWDVLEEESGDGMTAVLVGTHTDLVELDVMPAGEGGVAIMLMPDFIPGPDGESVQLSPEELASFMHASAMAEQAGVSEVQAITLANGAEAYTFKSPSPEADMTVHIFAPGEQALAVVAFITASGEEDAALLADANSVLNSIDFSGDPLEFTERARAVLGASQ